jgi:hypothetical protein
MLRRWLLRERRLFRKRDRLSYLGRRRNMFERRVRNLRRGGHAVLREQRLHGEYDELHGGDFRRRVHVYRVRRHEPAVLLRQFVFGWWLLRSLRGRDRHHGVCGLG